MLDSPLTREMDTVPPYDRYATVDELDERLARLAEKHPDVASLRDFGTSRLGETLHCLSIGDAAAPDAAPDEAPNAVVFALPHPNEPIGGLTALHLAQRLCDDSALRERTGLRWHIIACIDPDGTRLNEGWLHGPYTPSHYGRNFYRPAGDEQIEWTFPISYRGVSFDRVLPETRALMGLIDEVRPVFMCSLHNSESGGAYYYVSRGTQDLFDTLKAIPGHVGVPLDTGEPESPDLARFDTAVYRSLSARTIIDAALADGRDAASLGNSGGSSADYADRHGTFTLLSEVPYWTSPSADDDSPADVSYAEVLRSTAAGHGELGELLTGILRDVGDGFRTESPFLRATRFFAPALVGGAQRTAKRAEAPESDRPATVAERDSCRHEVLSFRLRYAGMMLRALDAEIGAGHGTPTIRARHAYLSRRYEAWCELADAELAAEPIEIARLVGIQYAAILASAANAMSTAATSTAADR